MSEWTPDLTRGSKFMSLVLRHQPQAAGLELDANGWVDIDALIAGANAAGVNLNRERLQRIVDTNPKRRFAIDETGSRIRAVQGHSVEVDLAYAIATPPDVLFHGTNVRAVDAILSEGLRPMGRQHVHLSADVATARTVGARRGRPVVLEVDAAAMRSDGVSFWQATNGVWLCRVADARHLRVIGSG